MFGELSSEVALLLQLVLPLFQLLLEECVSLNLAGVDISASGWQRELVKRLVHVERYHARPCAWGARRQAWGTR